MARAVLKSPAIGFSQLANEMVVFGFIVLSFFVWPCPGRVPVG